jgi:hypothetical protein
MRSPVALHVRITEDVAVLTGLLDRLEAELPEKKRNPHGGHGAGKGGHHPLAAWNSQIAMLVMDIHGGAREIELDLRYSVTGALRFRGGSDRNTQKSLSNLVPLCAGCDYAAVQLVAKRLEAWIWRARMVLGDAEPFSRLPRLPGQSDPRCPFCKTAGSLRVKHATGVVICLRPGCCDSDGNRTTGRVEVGPYSGQPLIAWASGETGVAGAA